MVENKSTNLEKKIVDDLLKTGFPLEVSVADTLNAARWRVNPSALYIDPDSKITRAYWMGRYSRQLCYLR